MWQYLCDLLIELGTSSVLPWTHLKIEITIVCNLFIHCNFYPSFYWSKTILTHEDNYPNRDMHKLCLISSRIDSTAQISVSSHVLAVETHQYWMLLNKWYDWANVFGRPKRSSFAPYGENAIQHLFVLDIHYHIINIYERLAPLLEVFLCRDLKIYLICKNHDYNSPTRKGDVKFW